MNHLVIVCGHSTYRGEPADPWKESSWVLAAFQRSDTSTNKPSEHTTFIQHILAGGSILDQDPNAILVFSGAKTQNEVNKTEAESYAAVYNHLTHNKHEDRIAVDTFATDSYQNLLFSILQFHIKTDHHPDHITVITHAFKERRFLTLHGPAIRWPAEKIRTIGINPSFTLDELTRVQWGENENSFKHFVTDPYAIESPLIEKKRQRGWKEESVLPLLESVEADVQRLVTWSGGKTSDEIFAGPLPWV